MCLRVSAKIQGPRVLTLLQHDPQSESDASEKIFISGTFGKKQLVFRYVQVDDPPFYVCLRFP